MVLVRILWPHGSQQASVTGSFVSWEQHYVMFPLENSPGSFQLFLDLPYRFLIDGVCRYDEMLPYVADDYGMINNLLVTLEENTMPLTLQDDPQMVRSTDVRTALYAGSPSSTIPDTLAAELLDVFIQYSRCWVSTILSNNTVYDMLPVSSKVVLFDAQLSVKQGFQIMYELGLPVVPIWDPFRTTVGGMLTASDFIYILRELQEDALIQSNEDLDKCTISDWKQFKFQQRNPVGSLAMQSPVIHASHSDSLKDVVVKIVQNQISSIPVFDPSSGDASSIPILTLASLPEILKYISERCQDPMRILPLLEQPISRIPIGTWLPGTGGRSDGHVVAFLKFDEPVTSAFQIFLQAKISSIPVVDCHGSLIDVFSRSDILTLTKGDVSAHAQLDQLTMDQALQLVYHNSGPRPSWTCYCSSTLREVIEQLSNLVVRRLVIVDPISKQLRGIISLRDVLMILL
ncbi:sucrose nonfermenting 4-like protein isoform X2 [Dioscorea cayenensis subsp. rotundata]|uniref:Sucrose nonfermenting 4-like protein isoform X2 n=1 Tax=Dioscorea cayennensis subsp. rotundata TaxID=55577 RepID=A0AB40C0Z5_DIOCR|nr:sucrose nonfermenting 4-like protein isoform X2 [Dioscorea cayenensis subsp. rotundata]